MHLYKCGQLLVVIFNVFQEPCPFLSERKRDSSEFCHSNDMTSNELAFCFCLFVNRTRPSDKIIYVLKLRSDEMMIQYAEYVGAQ